MYKRQNLNNLNKLFEKIELSKPKFSELLKFATIITHSFYSLSEKRALTIYSDLIKHESFRNTVPLLYVDYSHLRGIYSKVLTLIKKESPIKSDLFFVALMDCYRQFYTGGICENYEIKRPENFSTFNEVLKGRFYSYKIMLSSAVDSSLKEELFKECKTTKVSMFLEEVIPALLIKEEYKILTKLSDKFYEQIFESDNWSDYTMSSIYLIALANINWYSNNISTAKGNLELVVLEKVELSYYDYVSLFYYQTKIKISYLESDAIANAASFLILEKLVLKTSFIKFLEISKKYLLN